MLLVSLLIVVIIILLLSFIVFYPNRGYGIDGLHLFQNLQLQTHNYINMLYRLQVILNFFHIVSPLSIFYSTI